MKILTFLPLVCGAVLLSSCADIYMKDMLYGDPYERAARQNFYNAKAEGKSTAQAKAIADMVGNERASKEWGRREYEKEMDEESDQMLESMGLKKPDKWYEDLLPTLRWN